LLDVLLKNAGIATTMEFNSILKTIHNLFGFLSGKGKLDLVQDQLPLYYSTLISRIEINLPSIDDLNQQLAIIFDNITSCQSFEVAWTTFAV
jgi:hypothetical protein